MACFCYANIFSAALPLQVVSAPLEGSCKSCFDINMDMMTLLCCRSFGIQADFWYPYTQNIVVTGIESILNGKCSCSCKFCNERNAGLPSLEINEIY